MDYGCSHGNGLYFRTLASKQLEEIHLASCRVLEEVGMLVHHDEALKLLKNAGASIEEGNRVYFPTALINQSLGKAPCRVTLYNRKGDPAMYLEGPRVHFGTGSDTINFLDPVTGKRRGWKKEDVAQAARICDYLPHIDFVMSMGMLSDVHQLMINREQYALMLENSLKPQVVIAENGEGLSDIAEMAALAVGGAGQLRRKPHFMIYNEPTSPLQQPLESMEKLLLAAEMGIPTNFATGGLAGASVPVTVGGSLVQANAEALSGLVVHQLKKPGAPFIYGYGNSPMEMRTMQAVYGTPEALLFQGGLCDLARYYHLPSWGYAGCCNAKVCDEQAIMESTMFTVMGALQGCNIMHDVFYMEFGRTGSLELLLINHEVISRTKRMLRGVETHGDYLGVDAIKRVGPAGDFLGDEHTAAHFRENWAPELSDFHCFDNWVAAGSLTMAERARKQIQKILSSHYPEPLAPEVKKGVEDILDRSAKKLI